MKNSILTIPSLFRRDGSVNPNALTPAMKDWLRQTFTFAKNYSELLFCLTNDITHIPKCKQCGVKNVSFIKFSAGYGSYCSRQCAGESQERRQHIKETMVARYGVEYPLQSDKIQAKMKQTNLARYGTEQYSRTEEWRVASEKTSLAKYGASHIFKTKKFKEARSQTMTARYGSSSFTATEHYRNITKETNQQKYSRDWSSQRNISNESLCRLSDSDWLVEHHHEKQKSLSEISEELGVSSSLAGKYLARHGLLAKRFGASSIEKKLLKFIESTIGVDVETNTRRLIPPKEIDIYLPAYGVALEFNGRYWHSPDRYESHEHWIYYHWQKVIDCAHKNVALIHVWELDSWNNLVERIQNKQSTTLAELNDVLKQYKNNPYK